MALTILNIDTPIDRDKLLPVRYGSIGQCEAMLREMIGSSVAESARFTLSSKNAMLDAFAKVGGIPHDKVTTFTQVAVTANGKTTWARLKKGQSAGNRKTRPSETKHYSADTRKLGEVSIRDTFGLSLNVDPTTNGPDGSTVYVIVREATVTASDA